MDEKPKLKRLHAIKQYFERVDNIAPDGGRKVSNPEIVALKKADDEGLTELAELCCIELGCELDT